jgi:tetratricopeptide (TPR) repeat protein
MGRRKQNLRKSRLGSITLAAAMVLGAFALPCRAQEPITNDGHALDANNRIGSGGYNGTSKTSGYSSPGAVQARVTSNDIFYNNVSGLGGFNGPVPARDPYAFQGGTPFLPSQVLQQQSGVSSPTAPPTYNVPQPYYNADTHPFAPPGFSGPALGSGALSPVTPNIQQPQDYRLNGSLDVPTVGLPRPGTVVGPGQVDPTAIMAPSFLSATPLFGAKFLAPTISAGQSLSTNVNSSMTNSVITNSLTAGLSPSDIARLRGELTETQEAEANANSAATGDQSAGASPSPGAVPNTAGANGQILPPIVQNTQLSTGLISTNPGDAATGQSVRNTLSPLPAEEEQSPQYAKLRVQLDQYNAAHPKTDEEANRLFQQALRARRQYEQSLSKTGGPTTLPTSDTNTQSSTTGNPGPNQLATPIAPPLPPPAPVEIGSIGASIRSQGLSQLVQQGEDLARHQKFKDAITKFLDARQVAPNNMLIAIDLANAELGAGFYEQASQYLHDAFSVDPALLMGKYDLTQVLGPDRLQILIADLKHVATTTDSPTPVFLLGYLSYNTGEAAKAVEYLKLAESRSGGADTVIDSLRQHWALPQAGAAATTRPTP